MEIKSCYKCDGQIVSWCKICNKPLCSAHEYYCILCDGRFCSGDILECYKCEPPLPVTRCKKCDPKFVHTRHS